MQHLADFLRDRGRSVRRQRNTEESDELLDAAVGVAETDFALGAHRSTLHDARLLDDVRLATI